MAQAFQPEDFGSYRLTHLLGKGGMASVYRATREGPWGFAKQVAIKRLHASLNDNQSILKALINEARIGGFLKHPNIVEIYEFNKVRSGGTDAYYLAMEFVDGWTLDKVLKLSKELGLPIPPAVAIEIVVQVCAGLHYAHTLETIEGEAVRLVHRDIKPANIILARDGLAKVMDFGIAKAATNLYKTTLAGETTKGTPHYMSPEQVAGDPDLDARSDVFAIGSLLYELVTGQLLFKGDSLVSVLFAVAKAQVEEHLERIEGMVQGLGDVVGRCLQKDPSERYSNVKDLANDLKTVAATLGERGEVKTYLLDMRSHVIARDAQLQEAATVADSKGPVFATLLGGDWMEEDSHETEQLVAAREIADGLIQEIADAGKSPELVAGNSDVATWEETADVEKLSELHSPTVGLSPRQERVGSRLSVPGDATPDAETAYGLTNPADDTRDYPPEPAERTRDFPPLSERLPSKDRKSRGLLVAAVLLFLMFGVVGVIMILPDRGAGPGDQPTAQPTTADTLSLADNINSDLGVDEPTPEPVATPRPVRTPAPQPGIVPVVEPTSTPTTVTAATTTPEPTPVDLSPGPAPVPVTTTSTPAVRTTTTTTSGRPGKLQVKRAPTSLLVFVDGESIGSTPIFGYSLSPGRHTVRFKDPDTGDYSPPRTVTIPAGGSKAIGWYDFSAKAWKD